MSFITENNGVSERKQCFLAKGMFLIFISSPEPLGSQGELIVYPSSRRPASVVFVNNFKHLLLRNRLADQSQILCGASFGKGTIFCSRHLGHMTKMTATHIYGKTLQKSSSPEPAGRFSRNLVCSFEDSSPS